jgi:transposase, IS30 family
MSYHQLSLEERYTISSSLRNYDSQADLARAMGRSPSTISRELRRNQRPTGAYAASVAHSYSVARRRRTRRGSQFSEADWDLVVAFLKLKWSPEQIANWLEINGLLSISHETIYRYILKDKHRGGRLYLNLRHVPKRRRKRYGTKDSRGVLTGKRHISTRPQSIESRQEFGHWEADTVMGSDKHHCLLTLVERKTGMTIIMKLMSRTTAEVNQALLDVLAQHHPDFKSITFDNGTEFHDYKAIEVIYPSLVCYFATPYHSWERGSNENLNGLIRQYIPKGLNMDWVNQAYCNCLAKELNSRPRKRHLYRTPEEVYFDEKP